MRNLDSKINNFFLLCKLFKNIIINLFFQSSHNHNFLQPASPANAAIREKKQQSFNQGIYLRLPSAFKRLNLKERKEL